MIGRVRELVWQVKREDVSSYASGIAFFMFLSMVPMLIMVCTMIPYTPLSKENLLQAVTSLVPDALEGLIAGLIDEIYEKSAGVLSAAALTTLWSAGKGVQALIRGLNAVNEFKEERNFFLLRILSSLYTFVMLLLIMLSLFLIVFGKQMIGILLNQFPALQQLIAFLLHFRFLAVWMMLMLLFAIIYAWVPAGRQGVRDQMAGAAFAAGGWILFSWGFSLYVNHSGSYSMYGSLTLIVLVLIWMYVCTYLLILGAHLNKYLSST